MQMTNALAEAGVLRADEIAMLSEVYEELISAPQFLTDKPAREALAAHILQRYRTGTTNPAELKKTCMPVAKI